MTWICCRQRAGPLVKECRSLRPRFSADDTAADRAAKKDLRCAVNRKMTDRLELRLALFGWWGSHYVLTFDDEHLPAKFADARRELRNFLRRAHRLREQVSGSKELRYIYAIEGLHGDHRYHIHLILDDRELQPAVVRYLWRCGMVDDSPVLLGKGGYRRLAEYLTKERTDGIVIPIGRHPWSCSRSLNAELPAPERWTDESGAIDVPDAVLWARRGNTVNDFGAHYYASYIQLDGSRACARVRARVQLGM